MDADCEGIVDFSEGRSLCWAKMLKRLYDLWYEIKSFMEWKGNLCQNLKMKNDSQI